MNDPALIVSLSPYAPGAVPFDYNPGKISFKRSADMKQLQTAEGPTPSIFRKCELATITLSDIVLEGEATKVRCDQLLNWTAPPQSALMRGAMALLGVESTDMPTLIFQWGPPDAAFVYQVKLKDCGVTYERFNSLGIPVRAQVNLTMIEQPSLLGTMPTNPSSGGIPGRRVHTVHEGEKLAAITTEAYGHPRHWRAMAQENGIDDPLRIRPGDALYLPPAAELATRGKR